MSGKIHVLDIPIDNVTKKEAVDMLYGWLNENNKRVVYTPNPEMIMQTRKDTKLAEAMKKADMVIPDGIGVVWASKYSEQRIMERVPGCDVVQMLIEKMAGTDKSIFILGAAPQVAEKAQENLQRKYAKLKIKGTHHGYFKQEEDKIIVQEINKLKPDLLLVGLGVPRQEKWIYDNKEFLDFKVAIGIGGSIDVYAGAVKRAPLIFQKLNLEWFYRLLKQPSRFIRMLELPKFMFTVLKERKHS